MSKKNKKNKNIIIDKKILIYPNDNEVEKKTLLKFLKDKNIDNYQIKKNTLSRIEFNLDFEADNILDFIICFKDLINSNYVFLLVEVETQLFASRKQINDFIQIKDLKLSKIINRIDYKFIEKSNKNHNFLKVIIIKKSPGFQNDISDFQDNISDFQEFKNFFNDEKFVMILDNKIIEKQLDNLINKSVSLFTSIKTILKGESFIYPQQLLDQMYCIQKKWDNKKVINIEGHPGSGKTLIAIALYKYLIDQNKNVGFYTLVRSIWSNVNNLHDIEDKYRNNIFFGSFKSNEFDLLKFSNFDYIIIDECQRLYKGTENWVYQKIKKETKLILIGDPKQKIKSDEVGFRHNDNFKNDEILEVKLDTSFMRFTKEHLNFLEEFILKGKITKEHSSNLKFEYFNSDKFSIHEYKEKNQKRFEIFVCSSFNINIEKKIEDYGPLNKQGNECDIMILKLEDLEVEGSATFNEINFKSIDIVESSTDGREFTKKHNDQIIKSGMYCALTRATQKIIIVGTKEMEAYFLENIKKLTHKRFS